MSRRSARLTLTLASAALVVSCSGGSPAGQPEPAPPDPFSTVEPRIVDEGRRAFPRWEQVGTFSGSGAQAADVSIAEDALQWRVRWRCEGGARFSLAGSSVEPLADATCPGSGESYGIDTGALRLRVDATGPWRIVVEQEVDDPLREPPLPQMTAPDAALLRRGDFYEMERRGAGTALLYRLPDGSLALRLEGFDTTPSPDLFVWLSEAPRPQTAAEIIAAPYVDIGAVRSTAGDQNYLLPPTVDPAEIGSIVIWCAPLRIAYTAAGLSPA